MEELQQVESEPPPPSYDEVCDQSVSQYHDVDATRGDQPQHWPLVVAVTSPLAEDDETRAAEPATTEISSSREVATQEQLPTEESIPEYDNEVNESRFYRKLIDVVYDSISNEPAIPEESLFNLDFFFKAVDVVKTYKRAKGAEEGVFPFDSVNDLSPVLRRGRSKGWLLHRNMIFPLASTAGRTVWVTAEFIAVFITLVLSIARLSHGNNHIFNIVHLALSIFASILVFIDNGALSTGIIEKCIRAISTQHCDPENSRNEAIIGTAEKVARFYKKRVKNKFDVGRMVLSELIFYPLLICAMFDMILFESYFFDTEANQISFVLFIMSAILMLGFVYIPRIAVPLNAMYNLQKKRYFDRLIDITTTKSSIHLQNYFILHSLGQIVSQVVMTAAIGILIHIENENFVNGSQADHVSVDVSGSLWYTLVAGYILPFLGLISFCLTTYWWLQEFPIGISIDFITILSLPNITELLGIQTEEEREKINRIIEHFNLPQLKQTFHDLHSELWCYKFIFPFLSPLTVLFSLLFGLLHASFFISAFTILSSAEGSLYTQEVFLGVTFVIVYIMNFFGLTIDLFWAFITGCIIVIVAIVITVVAVVLIVIVVVVICFVCRLCGGTGSNNPHPHI